MTNKKGSGELTSDVSGPSFTPDREVLSTSTYENPAWSALGVTQEATTTHSIQSGLPEDGSVSGKLGLIDVSVSIDDEAQDINYELSGGLAGYGAEFNEA